MDGDDFTRLLGVFDTAPQESSYIFNLRTFLEPKLLHTRLTRYTFTQRVGPTRPFRTSTSFSLVRPPPVSSRGPVFHVVLTRVSSKGFINKLMGLKSSPECVLELTVKTTCAFLAGKAAELSERAEQTEGMQIRPIGVPGRIQYYSVDDLRLRGDSVASLPAPSARSRADSGARLMTTTREGSE